jgi:lysozyme
MLANLIFALKLDEGFSGVPYRCTKGYLTIGYGRNLETNPLPEYMQRDFNHKPLTPEEAEQLLIEDVYVVVHRIEKHFGRLNTVAPARYAVLVMMAYQLGFSGLLAFKNMAREWERGNYSLCALHMLDSKWYREDTPKRAWRLANQMLSGEWYYADNEVL